MEVNPPMGMGVLPEAGMGSYVGQIKLWFEDKGWGMIACDDTFRQYQKDIFFAKSVVTSLPVCQRDLVQFSIKMELKGPAATHCNQYNKCQYNQWVYLDWALRMVEA